jgi:isopenicillin-N N-acyltransferase like protein
MLQILDLSGDHYTMGHQHGDQVVLMKDKILTAMKERLLVLAKVQRPDDESCIELADFWEAQARPTMEMLRGMAASLNLDWRPFFRYTTASYVIDRSFSYGGSEGCTVWAAAGPVSSDGQPILVKNRDFRSWHQRIQCLVRAAPKKGYRYAYLTSAASPGVYSSGMNEAGLAVADTHVVSKEMGAGLARYSVMMNLLEQQNSVAGALEYLAQTPHMGDGNLTMVDAQGEMAVFESSRSTFGIVRPKAGYLVSANHYVTPEMQNLWVDTFPQEIKGNSTGRYNLVNEVLSKLSGELDLRLAKQVMSSHGSLQDSVCRHASVSPYFVTISTIFYLPQTQTILVGSGNPCQGTMVKVCI